MKTMHLVSPAKLNLFLHITGRRTDRYHELQTIFQFIDILDTLDFTLREDKQIILHDELDFPSEDNLIIKAAKCLQALSSKTSGIDITLKKNIPIGAGLGGGSSNAATTLLALNQLWRLELSQSELLKIALSLGADVPIFIRGHAAWAEGIGEKCQDIEIDEPWYVILLPDCAISTPEIFNDEGLTRNSQAITIRDFRNGEIRNDCESVVRMHYPLVDEALIWLNQFAAARMSGTGSAIFAAFDEKSKAEKIQQQSPVKFKAVLAKGCNISPLHDMMHDT